MIRHVFLQISDPRTWNHTPEFESYLGILWDRIATTSRRRQKNDGWRLTLRNPCSNQQTLNVSVPITVAKAKKNTYTIPSIYATVTFNPHIDQVQVGYLLVVKSPTDPITFDPITSVIGTIPSGSALSGWTLFHHLCGNAPQHSPAFWWRGRNAKNSWVSWVCRACVRRRCWCGVCFFCWPSRYIIPENEHAPISWWLWIDVCFSFLQKGGICRFHMFVFRFGWK